MNTKKIALGIISFSVRVMVIAAMIFVVYKAGLAAYDFGFRIFAEEPVTYGEGREVAVTIPEDQSALQIGEILEKNGLIRDSKLFFFQELVSAYHDQIKPGVYTLNTSMTATEMLEVIADIDAVDLEMEEDAKEGK